MSSRIEAREPLPKEAKKSRLPLNGADTVYYQPQTGYPPTGYYDNPYNGLTNCQQHKSAVMYPVQASHQSYHRPQEYCPQLPMPDFSQQGYQQHLGLEQVAPYPSASYSNWYTGSDNIQKQIPVPAQQPNHSIKDWLQNVEDNAHLQKTFEQIETEGHNTSKRKSCSTEEDNSLNYPLTQSPKKRAVWNNCQLMTSENKRLPPQMSQNHISSANLQPPTLKNCAAQQATDLSAPC